MKPIDAATTQPPRVRCEKTGIDGVARPAGRPRHLTVFKMGERHSLEEERDDG